MLLISASCFCRCNGTHVGPSRQGCLYAAFGRLLRLMDLQEILHSLWLLVLLTSGWVLSNRAEASKEKLQVKLKILGPRLGRFAHTLCFSPQVPHPQHSKSPATCALACWQRTTQRAGSVGQAVYILFLCFIYREKGKTEVQAEARTARHSSFRYLYRYRVRIRRDWT